MEEGTSFAPIDDTVGDLVAVEELSASVVRSTATARERAKTGQSSWWRTSIATLRRPRGEEREEEGGGAVEKKKTRAGLEKKRFATVQPSTTPRGTETRRRKKAMTASSSPDLTTAAGSSPTATKKKEKRSRDKTKKNESESEREKSEAAAGKEPKEREGAGPELYVSEVKPDHSARKKEERLQKSRSLSAIGQVAEEVEQRSLGKELDAVEEELKGPLPVRADMPDRQRKRHQVINEIVNTERAYVRDLQVLLAVFIAPMQSKGIVRAEEAKLMFSNVKTLLAINQTLLSDLISRVETTHGNNLGDSFLLFGDYLRMYATYCANQDTSLRTYVQCKKASREFREFLLLAQCHPDAGMLSLDSYLIKPVQRLCKYPLLLRELIGVTDAQHKDFERLNSALEKIRQVVARVNDSKKAEEEMEAMAKVIERLQGTEKLGVQLMVPGRKFLQEGVLHRALKNGKETQPSYYFLFSDLLVLSKRTPKRGAASAKEKAPKLDVKAVVWLTAAETAVDLRLDKGFGELTTTIEIVSNDSSGGGQQHSRHYVVPFASAALKQRWIEAFQAALERRASSPRPLS